MSTSHPTLNDICDAFARLAERVSVSSTARIDPFVSISVRRAAEELRRFIPGLDEPPDREAARFLLRAATSALEDEEWQKCLSHCLRGLSFQPHHPQLWYVAASACFEIGAIEDAIRMLRHTLWLDPGHSNARRDLEALSAYMAERWTTPDPPPKPPIQNADSAHHHAADADEDGRYPDSDRYTDGYGFGDDDPYTPDD